MHNNFQWTPTREAALKHLESFLPLAGTEYSHKRNFDMGAAEGHTNVSGLSPWLRHRCISEHEVVKQVLSQHSLAAANKFIQEICWRTYWKGWLEMHEPVWFQYNAELVNFLSSGSYAADANAAFNETTGIECFDHWCDELRDTGYLHNHARMWFASIWIFTLKLPWQLGADLFVQHLLDGDAASNTLSWRWVAGLHTKGKHYLATAENIAKFTSGRFNPDNQLATHAEPITETIDYPVQEITCTPDSRPIDAAGKTGFLLSDDDLTPVSVSNAESGLNISVISRHSLSPNGSSQQVQQFTNSLVHSCTPKSSMIIEDTNEAQLESLIERVASEKFNNLKMAYVPVGSNRPFINKLTVELGKQNITTHQVRCKWDSAFWPHANKGFFQLKKKIPSILSTLRLSTKI